MAKKRIIRIGPETPSTHSCRRELCGKYLAAENSGLEDEYWGIRNELEQAGLVTLGRGRGGSVALQLSAAPAIATVYGPFPIHPTYSGL